MANVKPIPDNYPAIIPYLIIRGAAKALEFYKQAFGAAEVMRLPHPDGRIGHAEIRLNGAPVMMADEFPEMGIVGPQTTGGSTVSICLYTEDVDKVFDRAVSLGAKSIRAVENKFYGDRGGQLEDPFGHRWDLMTHIEDVSPEEMARRSEAMLCEAQEKKK